MGKAVLGACIGATFLILFGLANYTVGAVKPVEIIRMPRFMFAGNDLAFHVRIRGAVDEDRIAFVMLCAAEGPCALDEFQHEQIDEMSIEGSAVPKMWAPKPFTHMPPGEFVVVAGLGVGKKIRVADALSVSVQGM